MSSPGTTLSTLRLSVIGYRSSPSATLTPIDSPGVPRAGATGTTRPLPALFRVGDEERLPSAFVSTILVSSASPASCTEAALGASTGFSSSSSMSSSTSAVGDLFDFLLPFPLVLKCGASPLRDSLRRFLAVRMKSSVKRLSCSNSLRDRSVSTDSSTPEALRPLPRSRCHRELLGFTLMVARPTRMEVVRFIGSFQGDCRYIRVPLLDRRSWSWKPARCE
mmetsp:Transcript_16769/g.63775  ORF Transcript_16769/g.63775 Transcript_16769/m.63775 type:complete len:221 (-) Transcript_16769:1416-2078(-)